MVRSAQRGHDSGLRKKGAGAHGKRERVQVGTPGSRGDQGGSPGVFYRGSRRSQKLGAGATTATTGVYRRA